MIDRWEIPVEEVTEIRRELNDLVVELKNGKSLRTEKPIKFE